MPLLFIVARELYPPVCTREIGLAAGAQRWPIGIYWRMVEVRVLEDDLHFEAGFGASLSIDGEITLDALAS